jgi:hypothetical protein
MTKVTATQLQAALSASQGRDVAWVLPALITSDVTATQLQAALSVEQSRDFALVLLALVASTELSANTKAVILGASALAGFFAHVFDFLEKLDIGSAQKISVSKAPKERVLLANPHSVEFFKPQRESAISQDFSRAKILKPLDDLAQAGASAVAAVAKAITDVLADQESAKLSFVKILRDALAADNGGVDAALRTFDDADIEFVKLLRDPAIAASSQVLEMLKDRQDQARFEEGLGLGVAKPIVESALTQDELAVRMLFNRVFGEVFKQQDFSASHLIKSVHDDVGLLDELYIGRSQQTASADGGSIVETQATAISKPLTDLAGLLGLASIGLGKSAQSPLELLEYQKVLVGKSLQDRAAHFDVSKVEASKTLVEKASASEAGRAFVQSFAESNYFESSYAGVEYSI